MARGPPPRAAQREAPAAGLQAEGDVVPHGQVREEGVGLEDHPDVAPLGGHPGDVLAVEQDPPLRGMEQAGQELQQGRLARARGADQHRDPAVRQLHRDAGEDRLPAVGEGDALDEDLHAGSPRWNSSPPSAWMAIRAGTTGARKTSVAAAATGKELVV